MADQGASKRNGSKNGTSSKISAREGAARVRDELPELLGRSVESVLGIQRTEDGEWAVTVAVVELARIPRSTDVLGAYRVTLDANGDMTGYGRQRRYNRNQADED